MLPADLCFDAPRVGRGLMFGKKLSKAFLVDLNGNLVREFIFGQRADVTFDQLKQVIQGRPVASLGAFQFGKMRY